MPERSPDTPWAVMVLAHNEERHIEACLDSILGAEPGRRFEIFVMANGCTDGTERLVTGYGLRRSGVHLVSIGLGDKCNAWNVFIHETIPVRAPGCAVYFFMDGDARAVPGSFSAMSQALERNPAANAASAVPASGRYVASDRQQLLAERGLVANLYALRGSFVQRLQQHAVRMPLKLEGDDGLIGALVKWDLDPKNNEYDHGRIVPCADAAFEFEPMSLRRPADWIVYWKRAVRYGRRKYEFQILGPELKAKGLAGMPLDITELYPRAASLRLHPAGIYTLSNWAALRQMRRIRR
ncbi:MAG: glycosyltransferase family A protein [Casimicrobiaceae bacterium]